MKNKRLYIVILFSIFTFTLFFAATKKLATKTLTITKSDGTACQVVAELARTAEERTHGYMGRKKIPDGTGMIFIFEQDQVLSFWMKNTPHPLSIAYIDSKGRIRNIYDMTPYSLSPIKSTVSVRYALEVPQGWFKANGIEVGDTIELIF